MLAGFTAVDQTEINLTMKYKTDTTMMIDEPTLVL